MARFIFDCEDEICLPAAYHLIEEVKTFVEKLKEVEVDDSEASGGNKIVFKKILENMMVKYPAETGKMFAKLWILEDGEKTPNSFKTMATLLSNEVAIDFFTSVLPYLVTVLSKVSPLLNSKK